MNTLLKLKIAKNLNKKKASPANEVREIPIAISFEIRKLHLNYLVLFSTTLLNISDFTKFWIFS